MTHGDKAKAKTAKSSQASAAKTSPQGGAKAGGKVVQSGKSSGKETTPSGGAPSKSKKQPGAEESSPLKKVASSKEAGSDGKGKAGKQAARPVEAPGSFTNPVISSAYKHAVKKYPNALRKLTD